MHKSASRFITADQTFTVLNSVMSKNTPLYFYQEHVVQYKLEQRLIQDTYLNKGSFQLTRTEKEFLYFVVDK